MVQFLSNTAAPSLKRASTVLGALSLMGLSAGAAAFTPVPTEAPIALADAWMRVSNFTILAGQTSSFTPSPFQIPGLPPIGTGNGSGQGGVANILPTNVANAVNPAIPALITIDSVQSNGSVNTTLNGSSLNVAVPPQGAGTAFSITVEQGSGAYEPNVLIPNGFMDATTYTGGHSSTYGNALFPVPTPFSTSIADLNDLNPADGVPGPVPPNSDATIPANANCGETNIGDCVNVHSQTNLRGGAAETVSNQGVTTQFTYVLTTLQGQWFELAFNAEGFLRAFLGQSTFAATASHAWSAVVRDNATQEALFSWTPDGILDNQSSLTLGACANRNDSGIGKDCFEYADAFSMNNSVTANETNENVSITNPNGRFEAELFLRAGTYTFQITHTERTNAAIPEPGTLALLGAGLVGLAARRRKTA